MNGFRLRPHMRPRRSSGALAAAGRLGTSAIRGTIRSVEKTTVYLPRALKSRLAKVAEEAGVSEAQLIREGVERVVSSRAAPRPRVGIFASGEHDLAHRVDEELRKGFGRD